MTQTASRPSKKTGLEWGFVEAPVALYATEASGKETDRWDARMVSAETGEPIEKEEAALPELEAPVLGDPLGQAVAPAPMRAPASGPVDLSAFEPPEEDAKEAVERHRGLETASGWVDLEEPLGQIETVTRLERMGVGGFVRLEQVDRAWIKGSYWVGPDGPGAGKVLRVLYAACRATGRAAVVKWLKTTRQAHGVLVPHRSGAFLALELAWPKDRRTAPKSAVSIQQAPVTDAELDAGLAFAREMAERPVMLERLRDDAVVLREQLRELALQGRADEFAVPSRVDAPEDIGDLMKALEGSVGSADEFVESA